MRALSDVRGLVAVATIASATACDDWPRSAYLDDPAEYATVGDEFYAEAEWEEFASDVDAEDFSNTPRGGVVYPGPPLSFGKFPSISGLIDGTGWGVPENDDPETHLEDDFDGSHLSPTSDEGFYRGDVDLFQFALANDSYVCGAARVADEGIGWDFALFEIVGDEGEWVAYTLDRQPIDDDDENDRVVGANINETSTTWGRSLPAGDYGMLIGVFNNVTGNDQILYTAGIAVYAPFLEENAKTCPLPPALEVPS